MIKMKEKKRLSSRKCCEEKKRKKKKDGRRQASRESMAFDHMKPCFIRGRESMAFT
jgi:hypothetical protein